ncbi:MAG: putative Beta-lactamase [Reyranella sp.]|nr:putative Beta-lactamase [Reyranella sp.]
MEPSISSAQSASWQSQSPEAAGFTPDLSARLDRLIADKRIWNVHAVLVARHGKLLLERYFEGTDDARGRPLGTVAFGPDTLHDLRSVSKSIVGVLYGMALAQGKVPPPEAPLLRSFPDYADLAADPGRAKWTVHHVLTMTMGTDWDELGVPYTDPTNSEIAMDRAADRYRYVLERPLVFEPGTRWVYNGGATALLGRMIAQGTGKSLHDFAREALFDPLGLGASEWPGDAKGDAFAASGLRLRPRDLLRIGQLVLQGGEIDGRRIVPKEWIARATTQYVSSDEFRRYGYQWYMGDIAFSVPTAPRWNRNRLELYQGAIGNGGQRLWVLPGLDLVVAVTAGNYDTPDQWVPPIRVLREAVLASVV